MGRRPWTNRLTVEDCPVQLSIKDLDSRWRVGVLVSGFVVLFHDPQRRRDRALPIPEIRQHLGLSLYLPPQVSLKVSRSKSDCVSLDCSSNLAC
jgi:hypothetical protein